MGFLLGLLTAILVLDCIVLIFLVLIQLPKKEAGAGLAFGAGATDALFGAGSGTVLTKITKYAAAAFFVLALLLAVLQRNYQKRSTSEFEKQLQTTSQSTTPKPGNAPAPVAPLAATPAPGTNTLLSADVSATNPPAQPSSNPPAPAAEATDKK